MMRVEDPFCDLNDYFDFEPQTIQDTHCEDLFEEFYDTDFLDILQDITDTVCGSQQADFDQSQSSAVGNSGESSVDLSCNVSGINERGSHLGSWSANDEHSPFSEPCSTLSDVNQDQHNACMEGVANLASPDEQILLEVLPEYQVEEDMTGLIEMGDAVTSSQVVKQEDLLLRGYQTCDVDKGIVATGFDQGMFLSDNSEHSPCSNTSSGSDSYDLDALGGISPSSEASVTFSNIPSVKVSPQPVQPNLPRPVIIAPSVRSAKTYSGSVSVASNVHVVSSKQQPIIYTVKTSQWNSSRVANGSAGAGLSQRQILSHPYLRTSATVIRSVQRNPQVGAPSTHPVVNVSPANVTEEQPKYVIQKVVQGTKPCEVTPVCLTDEEYQVFVAEGYPIPQRYPLSKSDEKNLKKVRRKLKNKWSAQESRRKKKEFVESLQEQCESISSENGELRKRVSDLEHDNRTLISQLRKLQDLVSSFGATTFKTAAAIRVPQTKQLCRMETTSDKQAAVAANGRNSTVLMMFTMVFASLLLGSSPFGVNSYLQYTHDASNPVVFASLPSRHTLEDSSESIGYQLSARILKNSLLLLSPFAPARVVHADLSAFRPNEQEVKSRVLQFPVGEKHANPLAPSAAQEKGFASSLPGPEKLEKALIPIRYQDITLWSDSETAVFYNPTEERLAFIQFYGKVDEKTNASEEFVVELPNLLTLSKQVNIEDATVEFEAGCCLTSSLNRSTELEAEKAL